LAEEHDPYNAMYVAPESGLTNIFSGNFSALEERWGDAIHGKRFYLKARDAAVFGRAEIEVYSSYGTTDQARLWIKYTVNPSGARILQ
jgi:hypothetical protein